MHFRAMRAVQSMAHPVGASAGRHLHSAVRQGIGKGYNCAGDPWWSLGLHVA